MTNSPENEQTPARDGAHEADPTQGTEHTRQIPVAPTQQIPAPQASAEQPTAPLPTAPLPTAPDQIAPQPTAGPGLPPQPAAPPQQVPPQQVPPQAAPQPPVGWGHPAPRPPAGWGPAASQPEAPRHDPFALPGAHPTEASAPQPAPAVTMTARPRRLWPPVIGAATAAALIASFATVGLTGGFGDDGTATSPASLATIGQATTDTAPVTGSTSDNPNWEKVAAAVSASVVAIQVTTAGGGAEGSGVIIDDSGHILTNNHVVSGAESVQVTLSDGRLYKATIVGTDATTDLAVVQITDPPSDLSPAALGDSGSVVVGEAVMAVGNPLGLANTVTTGIVSAVDRPVSASAETGNDVVVTNAIQIDAAINPGNSGGPLFDAEGRVIGITSSIATLSGGSSTSGSIGLGFAIPINLAQSIASQLVKSGTAEHAFLGVSLTDGEATADGTTRRGAEVQQVTSGSPAAEAGVQTGDVVVAIDGKPVAGAESLTAYVRERAAGSTAKLTVVRDGKALDLTVTLAAKPAAAEQNSSDQQGGSSQNGSDQGGQNPFDQFFNQG